MGIVVRQSLKGTLVNYIGVLLGVFVQLYVVTKYLDPEVVGLTKVVYEVSLLAASFALLGSSHSSMRFYPYFRNKDRGDHGFFYYYLAIPLIGVVLLSAILLLFKSQIIRFFGAQCPVFEDYFIWVLPLMVILTFWQFFENYANIHMRIAIPKAVREVGMRLLMLCCYLAYGFGYVGVEGLIISFLFAYGGCLLATGSYALHIAPPTFRSAHEVLTPELKRRFGRYTAFLILTAASSNIMAQLDLFMLSSVKGMFSGGIYTIVLYMAAVIEMPTRSISAISSPLAAEAIKAGHHEEAEKLYKQVSIHQLMACSMLLLLVAINLENIYAVLPRGEFYAQGYYAVLFLGLSKLIYSTFNFGNILISYSRYYYWTFIISLVLFVLTIFSNLYLIPLYGISGAALATLITSVLSYSFQQYVVQRKLHTNPLSIKTLIQIAIVIVLYLLNLCIPSMDNPWMDMTIRSLLIGGLGLFLIHRFHISSQLSSILETMVHKVLKR